MRAPEGAADDVRVPVVLRWLLPSLTTLAVLIVVILQYSVASKLFGDGDTGYHIRTGDWILAHRAVPREDIFSYTMPGRPWYSWEWLTAVVMSVVHTHTGLRGVGAAAIAWLATAYAGVALRMRWLRVNGVLIAALMAVLGVSSIVHWLARPHIVTIGFMVVWLLLVDRLRPHALLQAPRAAATGARGLAWCAALVALTAIWANFHAGFVVVLPMLCIIGVGDALTAWFNGAGLAAAVRGPLVVFAGLTVASAVAGVLTPGGVDLYRHVWQYLGDRAMLDNIDEFQSPNFNAINGRMVEIQLVLAAGAAAAFLRARRFADAGLAAFWAHYALSAERHAVLGAVVTIPLAGQALTLWGGQVMTWAMARANAIGAVTRWLRGRVARLLHIDAQTHGGAWVLAVVLGAWSLAAGAFPALGASLIPAGFDPAVHPVAAADTIERAQRAGRLRGRVFATDEYGDYLIYRFKGTVKVFTDGRSDFYRTGTTYTDYLAVVRLTGQWQAQLDRADVRWLLLPDSLPLTTMAQASPAWRMTHHVPPAMIFERVGEPVVARDSVADAGHTKAR